MRKLPRRFYARDTVEVAEDLLGCRLVHDSCDGTVGGRIVEVEAYQGPEDLAAHSARGRTPRNEVMFGAAGHLYVYLIYGIHHCLNIVTGPEGHAAAVLIRALEPVHNLPGKTSGPGLLCKALGVDRRSNGLDLLGGQLYLVAPAAAGVHRVVKRPRIGVDYAGAWARRLLRFYVRGSEHVSRP
ncbi:MAG: DNA-3-methyladenine glycosylase [Gammaproteobacteria bacterium]